MVRSVSRTFEILETIAHHPQGIGVNEIARQTDLHKSTVSRLLTTLEEMNIVARHHNGAGFRIGQKLQQLAAPANDVDELISVTRPFLEQLCATIGEDIGLAVPDGDGVLYLDQVFSQQTAVHVRDWTGSRFPYHVTSSGKLMMAFWPAEKLDAYLKQPLLKFSQGTITDPAQLRQRLQEIQIAQCDWTTDEFASGFRAVSAPIFDPHGQVMAAINIYAPSYRFPCGHKEVYTRFLLNICHQLTMKLSR